jgi:hypothetical protein
MNDKLFIGMYPTGVAYADRSREIAGDYVRLAFMLYSNLKVVTNRDCPPDLRESILESVKSFKDRQGESILIGGGYVHLGSDYETAPKFHLGKCKGCGEITRIADGKCRGCRFDSLAGMYWHSGKYTAWQWFNKTGVNPRFVRMDGCYDLIDVKGIGYWTERTEAVYQQRVREELVFVPRSSEWD